MKTFLKILVVLVSAFVIFLPSFALADENDTHGEYVFDRGDRVDTYNGILTFPKTDLFLPGKGGLDLRITRTYSSQINADTTLGYYHPWLMGPVLPVESPFGMGWNFQIGKINIDKKIIYYGDGGSEELFYDNYSDTTLKTRMKTRQYAVWEYEEEADTSFLKMPSGIILKFYMNTSSSDKYVIQIEDKNGNHIDIEYLSADSSLIDRIYDTLGRTVWFTYCDTAGYKRLSKISYLNSNEDTSEIAYEYYFAKIGKPLAKVTYPNGTYESYDYTDWFQCEFCSTATGVLLETVYLPTGGRIEYLYSQEIVSKWLVGENDTGPCDSVSELFTHHSVISARSLYDTEGLVSDRYVYYNQNPYGWDSDSGCHNLRDYSSESYPEGVEGTISHVEESVGDSVATVDYIYYPYIMTDDTSTSCMKPWYVGNLKSLRWWDYNAAPQEGYIKAISFIYDKQIIGYTDPDFHTEDSAVWIPVVKDIYKSSYWPCVETPKDRDSKAGRYIRDSHTGAILKSEVYSLSDTLSDWNLDNAQQYLVRKDTVVNFELYSNFNYLYVDSAMSVEGNDTVHNKYYYNYATQGSYLKSLDSTKLYSGGYTLEEHLAYDTFGNVSQTVNPNSDTLHYNYDSLGAYRTSVSSSVYGIMDSTTYYDNSGLVKTKVDANGNETKFYYDSADRIDKIVKPLDGDTTSSICYTYDNSNRINYEFIKQNSSNYIKNSKHFDEFGRLYETRIYNGNDTTKTTTEYNSMGKPERVSRAFEDTSSDTVWTEFKYDILGRTIKTINPDDTRDSTYYHELTVERFDELDKRSKSISDVRGNLLYSLANWDEDSSAYLDTISYTYGTFNLLLEAKDPKGFVTKYGYNSLNRISADSTVDGGENLYIYDKAGNLRFRKDANGDWIYNKYDQLNRLIEQGTLPTTPTQSNAYDSEYPDGIGEEEEIKNKYDSYSQGIVADDSVNHTNPKGNLTEVMEQGGTGHTSYFYDKRNRLAQKDIYITGLEKTIKYHYNHADQVDTLYYPNGDTIFYEYDQMGRLENIPGYVETGGSDPGFEYTPWGTIKQISFNDTMLTLVDYNDRSFVTGIRHKKASLLWGRGYGYDATGNIIREYSLNAGGDSTGMLRAYQYDDMYRLTSALLEDYHDTLSYGYDKNGNRTFRKVNDDSTAYFYDSGTNQLNHITDQDNNNYVYNDRGSVTKDSSKAIHLHYDYRNMLVSVDKKKTLIRRTVHDYLYSYYNSNGQRVKKTHTYKYACSCEGDPTPQSGPPRSRERGPGQCICSNTVHTYYFYSGNQVIAEYDGNGNLIAKYVYGNGQRLAKVNADADIFYYHNDYLGSTRIMTDESGSKIFERDYYPFGTALFVSGSETDYKYNGKEFDEEMWLHLYYYGARFYDPNLGRFISVDPVNHYTNPYSYVGNNPINMGDPTGMVPVYKIKLTKGGNYGGFGDVLELLVRFARYFTNSYTITLEIQGEMYIIPVEGCEHGGVAELVGGILKYLGVQLVPAMDHEPPQSTVLAAELLAGTGAGLAEAGQSISDKVDAAKEYVPIGLTTLSLGMKVAAHYYPPGAIILVPASYALDAVGTGMTTYGFFTNDRSGTDLVVSWGVLGAAAAPVYVDVSVSTIGILYGTGFLQNWPTLSPYNYYPPRVYMGQNLYP